MLLLIAIFTVVAAVAIVAVVNVVAVVIVVVIAIVRNAAIINIPYVLPFRVPPHQSGYTSYTVQRSYYKHLNLKVINSNLITRERLLKN